jgi:hypothetical protein
MKQKNKSANETISQRERFIEAARKAGASEDEREFDRALKRVAKAKPEKKAER